MAAKSWTYTRLAPTDGLILEIDAGGGLLEFPVVQWSSTQGVNEIPHASCLLGLGRNVRLPELPAAIHQHAGSLTAVMPAKVWLHLEGERNTSGAEWPDERQLVFEGYFLGLAHRKVNGQVQVVAQLVHWLFDLTASSSLGANSHPSNAVDLLFPAAAPTLGSGTEGPPLYVPQFLDKRGGQTSTQVKTDLWSAMKDFLCDLAESEGVIRFPRQTACDNISGGRNDLALRALRKIEGGSNRSNCRLGYTYGRALPFDTTLDSVAQTVADFIAQARLDVFISQTFWDVIIGQYCANFLMGLVPLVDRALVVAHTPTLQTPWVTIPPNDYAVVDNLGYLVRPLRGVAILGGTEMDAGTNARSGGEQEPVVQFGVAGCFQPSVVPDTGTLLFRNAPVWLRTTFTQGSYAGASTGSGQKKAPRSSTTTAGQGATPRDPKPNVKLQAANDLYRRFAQVVYHEEMLRGRSGVVVSKLRFDVAPGSIIKLEGSPERLLGAEDSLAIDHYGHVTRVVVNLNAESGEASTTMQLTHLRTAAENDSDRFSLANHPLFGSAAFRGAALVPALSAPTPPSA